MRRPLLIEIGCEEIPARMIPAAAADFSTRVIAILDQAGLWHRAAKTWGGTRRLAVHVEEVEGRQADREEDVLGPPASLGFDPDGRPTPAALGFARKQGVDPSELRRVATEKGDYVGLRRLVRGKSIGELLAVFLPQTVEGMTFPKTMRWGEGKSRWVRPVHWVVALHGEEVLPVEIFGVRAGRASSGHRFLAASHADVSHADRYPEALRAAHVIVDAGERREVLRDKLRQSAEGIAAVTHVDASTIAPVEDELLLEEVVDLVEWPGVIVGRFPDHFLEELPREVVETTLRHHQKSFSVHRDGRLLGFFLSVSNTDRDPAGHIRRGNEWVVVGRLEDALFFWREDRKRRLGERLVDLAKVTFHAKLGTYADKSARMEALAETLARRLDLPEPDRRAAAEAARIAKADLVTGLVGEFPELQGIVGGLLLRAEGQHERIAEGVYEHYKPAGAEDSIPPSLVGCLVSVADRLDTVAQLLRIGEAPTGSKDPFGLRRALNGVFRIVEERAWQLSLNDLFDLTGSHAGIEAFLEERYVNFLKERDYKLNEIEAVRRPQIQDGMFKGWHFGDIVARLEAIKTVRGRDDFEHLVDLTKRVDNILVKEAEKIRNAIEQATGLDGYSEREPAAIELGKLIEEWAPQMRRSSEARRYGETVEIISRFIEPVERFFAEVLVIDPKNPDATVRRKELLASGLKPLLTSYFDIRELAGQAERKA